jgi:hypothetical protein
MCFIREYDPSLMPMYYKKKHEKKKTFTRTFFNINESRNLTIHKLQSWKKNLTLDMSKYDFKYVCQKKSWLQTCPNITLNMFVKGKINFKYIQVWLLICLPKKELTLDMSKYDFEYVC